MLSTRPMSLKFHLFGFLSRNTRCRYLVHLNDDGKGAITEGYFYHRKSEMYHKFVASWSVQSAPCVLLITAAKCFQVFFLVCSSLLFVCLLNKITVLRKSCGPIFMNLDQ